MLADFQATTWTKGIERNPKNNLKVLADFQATAGTQGVERNPKNNLKVGMSSDGSEGWNSGTRTQPQSIASLAQSLPVIQKKFESGYGGRAINLTQATKRNPSSAGTEGLERNPKNNLKVGIGVGQSI